jgi:hypothetical protein
MSEQPISCALVCLRTGSVLELLDGPSIPRVADLANAAAAVLCSPVPRALAAAFVRLGSERDAASFQELSFVSSAGAHVLQQLSQDVALVAVSPDPDNLGAVLAAARARRSLPERLA